ncbi:Sodium/calcium exchanger membrane region [Candidatus Syntrophocurvum alkaliphilum]|uniref:Sodium/calcium exchanger membrane region n=1 Tax=Candidatus Syntrophocurvum alkaliphilum TaxID=2293317 RepID=A0A6I6DC58_9FIRM|nr:sodium:calcium antiporter [Candidatus Syntrophocurvum alkaliphilum]QGT99014.1 Sodium/calcium exchanger membrane region [Candidatus Syntrophocurvum alkaliphilum]
MSSIAILLISLGVILIGAEIFVNGIEWLGKKLNLSQGAVGSVLAAVGTALPESMIPIIAFLTYGEAGHEIGTGAIIGAPLMLSTLAMFVAGIAVYIFRNRRFAGTDVVGDYSTMSRDLGFFIFVFTVAVLAGLIPPELRTWQLIIGGFLVVCYFWYVYILVSEKRNLMTNENVSPMYFARKQESPSFKIILIQVLVALTFIILGAHMFVGAIKEIAVIIGVPAFVIAIIIAPVATELPEKFNSLIWISREKDTLALGNLTGAMVFQSSLIPAVGIFLTPWQLGLGPILAALIALVSGIVLYFELRFKRYISLKMLLICGIFYAIFLIGVFTGLITWG